MQHELGMAFYRHCKHEHIVEGLIIRIVLECWQLLNHQDLIGVLHVGETFWFLFGNYAWSPQTTLFTVKCT